MSVFTDRLFKIVNQRYPECTISNQAAFFPMHTLDGGDLSTTAAVEIARGTKQRAEKVADTLIADLAQSFNIEQPGVNWRNDKGYIVALGTSGRALLSEVSGDVQAAIRRIDINPIATNGDVHSVWCLLPDSTEPVYARLRILARATLQGLLAVTYCGSAELCVLPHAPAKVSSQTEVLDLFRKAVLWVLNHHDEVRRDVDLPEGSSCLSVWTSHHYHEKLAAATKNKLQDIKRSHRTRVIMPTDGWLLSRDRALAEILEPKALKRVLDRVVGHDGWRRLLFHLASTTPSGDFDPAVALFDECSSPLWGSRELANRHARFFGAPLALSSLDPEGLSFHEVASYRKLALCGLFMPVYTARAILHNQIETWCLSLERLVREGHAFINAPMTRAQLEQGSTGGGCAQIAASLGFGLSCILPLVAEE